ncbi:unnamed protein product [Mytilus coruscus]|uniref:Uncharacterized protein n=1 Tax=Mytilus coruscus TaxID=42192 RepID=A0A6J8EQ93_MYTCO|nr:unnamed protein product [Mytilus coruscus]
MVVLRILRGLMHNITNNSGFTKDPHLSRWINKYIIKLGMQNITSDRVYYDIHSPESCFTGMILYHFGNPELVSDRRDCNNSLYWYLCKSTPKIEQNDVFSSNATNAESNITADIISVITSNQTYGIASSCESNSNIYAMVNKTKTPCSSSRANDDIYLDLSNGENDRLNEVQKRKILMTENLYDSNEGIRNENDPTYNSSDFCKRKTNNHDSDIDMYSIMFTNSSSYTLNLT